MSITIPTPLSGVREPIAQAFEAVTDLRPKDGAMAAQVAALCWRLHKGRTQVLLVTSRDTGRWVLPKGWPIAGLTAMAAAAREAWEEAGVEGVVQTQAIGAYCYDKSRPDAAPLRCCVEIFPLRVGRLKSRFPEHKQRRRKWFGADEAASLVAEPDLATLFQRLHDTPDLLSAPRIPVTSSL